MTTNAANLVDAAFLRRLDAVVSFSPPDAEERLAIWMLHLPADHAVTVAFLELVARRCQLTGAQIRNAALHASLLELDGGGPIDDGLLGHAVGREYRRAGLTYSFADVRHRGLLPFQRIVDMAGGS